MDMQSVLYNISRRTDINFSALEERALDNAIAILEQANSFSRSVEIMEKDLEGLSSEDK